MARTSTQDAMKCPLRKQSNDSFGELNSKTSSELDRAAEFRRHGQSEFPLSPGPLELEKDLRNGQTKVVHEHREEVIG